MKRRTLSILPLLLAGATATAQTSAPKPTLIKDPGVVLKLLRGEVLMVGATFPNVTFQKGVVSLVKSKVITRLTVLTTAQNAATYAPLKALGAQVYYLPVASVRMTGNLVFAGDDAAILSSNPQQWYVVQAPQVGAQGRASMGLYLKSARKY